MAPISEREKVRRITNALEHEIEGQLFLNNHEQPVGRIEIDRRGYNSELGSPDVLVWVTIELHIFGALTRLKVPILVEAEEAGYSSAKEDIRKFFERDKLEIPMVVVARNGALSKEHVVQAVANVEVTMKQVGSQRLPNM